MKKLPTTISLVNIADPHGRTAKWILDIMEAAREARTHALALPRRKVLPDSLIHAHQTAAQLEGLEWDR